MTFLSEIKIINLSAVRLYEIHKQARWDHLQIGRCYPGYNCSDICQSTGLVSQTDKSQVFWAMRQNQFMASQFLVIIINNNNNWKPTASTKPKKNVHKNQQMQSTINFNQLSIWSTNSWNTKSVKICNSFCENKINKIIFIDLNPTTQLLWMETLS